MSTTEAEKARIIQYAARMGMKCEPQYVFAGIAKQTATELEVNTAALERVRRSLRRFNSLFLKQTQAGMGSAVPGWKERNGVRYMLWYEAAVREARDLAFLVERLVQEPVWRAP